MFLFGEPSSAWISEVLNGNRDAPFSYAEVGGSRTAPAEVRGYTVDHNRVGLGAGTFDRAVSALQTWKMFDLGWVRLLPENAPVEVGTTVAVLACHYHLRSLNPCRVVYLIDEDEGPVRKRGFAYGTLPEHAQRGEERFTVEQYPDGSVFYDLYAFSRPNHPLARYGRPFARALQRRFARDSLNAMVRATGTRY